MKRILLLAILFVPFLLNAQTITSPKSITSDQNYYYLYGDTLEKEDTISQYYYVRDFCQDLRLELDLDTIAAGYIKVNTVVSGSINNSDWHTLTGNVTGTSFVGDFAADSTITGTNTYSGTSTIATAGTTSATSTTLYRDIFDNYIKVTTIAVDSTQYCQFKYRILFNTND